MAAPRWLLRDGDLLLAVGLAVVMTTEIALWSPADLVWAIPAGLLATLPLVSRRRTPLVAYLLEWAGISGVLVFAPGFDNDSVATIAVFLVALYSLGRYSARHEVWLGGVAVLTGIIWFDLYDNSRFEISGIAFSLAFIGGPWVAGLTVKLRHERESTLTERNLELETDQAEEARRAVARERVRIARELHDVVSHAISITVLQARGGRKMLGVDEDAVRRALDAIEHTNTQALGDMRRLLSLLRDDDDAGRSSPPPPSTRWKRWWPSSTRQASP